MKSDLEQIAEVVTSLAKKVADLNDALVGNLSGDKGALHMLDKFGELLERVEKRLDDQEADIKVLKEEKQRRLGMVAAITVIASVISFFVSQSISFFHK
jgi:hypothetical protein